MSRYKIGDIVEIPKEGLIEIVDYTGYKETYITRYVDHWDKSLSVRYLPKCVYGEPVNKEETNEEGGNYGVF